MSPSCAFWLGVDRGYWKKLFDRVYTSVPPPTLLSHARDSVQPESSPVMLETAESVGIVSHGAKA